MKYIRTYGDYNSWKLDYSNPDRGFRLKPTLYKYSDVDVESKILLETDDPRKHGDSTYMEITLDSDARVNLYISNKVGDTQTTMTCTIDWGDGTVETKTITKDNYGFNLSHNYKKGSYKIELYDVEREYIVASCDYWDSFISPVESVKRVILGDSVVSIGNYAFMDCSTLTSIILSKNITDLYLAAFMNCTSLTSISSLNTTAPSLNSSYNDEFNNVSVNGILHIKPGATGYDANVYDGWLRDYWLSGWVIVEDL